MTEPAEATWADFWSRYTTGWPLESWNDNPIRQQYIREEAQTFIDQLRAVLGLVAPSSKTWQYDYEFGLRAALQEEP